MLSTSKVHWFRQTSGVVFAILLLGAGPTACGTTARDANDLRGTVLTDPWPKPDFTLTTTAGESFRFRRDTEGHVVLLFFGYTNCPDVCPIHMANIAAVLRKLQPSVADRIKVVFVTTDPDRDTAERVREWLDKFDPRFVGLIGPLDSVNTIQRNIGLPAAVKLDEAHGNYLVGHAAHVVAYTTDNRAHVVYPSGTRQVDWAHDLPKLVDTDW